MVKVVDGQIYTDETQIPDLGSIECVDVEGKIRHYRGVSADEAKLDLIDYVASGSSCIMADTGDMYIFANGEWYKTFPNS